MRFWIISICVFHRSASRAAGSLLEAAEEGKKRARRADAEVIEMGRRGARGAPRDWQKKNLQPVLHVKVIAGAPGSPKVVKQYFW